MYDEFYGLSGRPFQLTPDPVFYFESATHRKAQSYLSYGLAQGEGFLVITGEVGAGKSMLAAHLMGTIDATRLTAAQIVTSKLDGEELVRFVAHAFGLKVQGHDKASALAAIEAFLHDQARAGRRCLLVVDESQNLTVGALEELRMLSNLQLGSQALLQILLLGQPEFREALLQHPDLEQLRQRVIAMHHLDAMEADEVQAYIEHRMERAGWAGNPGFDPAVVPEVFAATGGVPRRINEIVNRVLMLAAIEHRSRIDCSMLQQVLGELSRDAAPLYAPLRSGAQPRIEVVSGITGAEMQETLAERDAQIAELQQAIIELAGKIDGSPVVHPELAIVQDRIAALESQVIEQERAIRHTLTMVIEWIEAENSARAAA